MALRNAFENLGLDSTLQAIRNRLPVLTAAGRMPVDVTGVVQAPYPYYATQKGGNAAWNSSTSSLSVSVSGEQNVALLYNPPDSGVDLYIAGVELSNQAVVTWRRYRGGSYSTTGLVRPSVNRGGDNTKTAKGRLYEAGQFGVTSASGQVLSKVTHLGANNPQQLNMLNGSARIRPGQEWYFTAQGAGGLTGNVLVSVFIEWWELAAEA